MTEKVLVVASSEGLVLEVEFKSNNKRGRYAAMVDGHRVVLTFVHEGNAVIAADHTYVPPELEGRGIAAAIVTHAVEDARKRGWKIRPTCTYVEYRFGKHPEWADVLHGIS